MLTFSMLAEQGKSKISTLLGHCQLSSCLICLLSCKPTSVADLPTVPLLAGQSRFLPNVPRPAKSWKCPAFCTKSDFFFARAQFVTLPRCPDVNANHPIERNYGNYGIAAESPCNSVFWNAIDFCRLYTSKKSQCGPCQPSRFLPASPAFFFTRNVPLKTFSSLAGLVLTAVHHVCCVVMRNSVLCHNLAVCVKSRFVIAIVFTYSCDRLLTVRMCLARSYQTELCSPVVKLNNFSA